MRTTLWRANWRTGTSAHQLTTTTGEVGFAGSQYDIVRARGPGLLDRRRHGHRAEDGGPVGRPHRRSGLGPDGHGRVRADGVAVAVSGWWPGHARSPCVNLETDELVSVPTQSDRGRRLRGRPGAAIGTLGGTGLVTLDLERPDGSQRRRVAGGRRHADHRRRRAARPVRSVDHGPDRRRCRRRAAEPSTTSTASRIDLVADGRGQRAGTRRRAVVVDRRRVRRLTWHALDLRTVA